MGRVEYNLYLRIKAAVLHVATLVCNLQKYLYWKLASLLMRLLNDGVGEGTTQTPACFCRCVQPVGLAWDL